MYPRRKALHDPSSILACCTQLNSFAALIRFGFVLHVHPPARTALQRCQPAGDRSVPVINRTGQRELKIDSQKIRLLSVMLQCRLSVGWRQSAEAGLTERSAGLKQFANSALRNGRIKTVGVALDLA
jgi:hypothetical protein